MPSVSSSPTHAPIMANATAGGSWSGQKRRPIDPEQTGFVSSAPYGQPNTKRPRTINDVLGSLSLGASDPPGNSFCYKRKHDAGAEDGPTAKVARSAAGGHIVIDPEGRKGDSPTNVTSELLNSNSITSCAPQNFRRQQEGPTKSVSEDKMDMNGMATDDNDHESDSSVSESSIRNAMYQLVFGRKKPPLPLNVSAGSGCGQYDAVDSKIEDIIRRSRLEAVIKSQKKGSNNDAASGMDVDMGADEDADEDEEWHPGHG